MAKKSQPRELVTLYFVDGRTRLDKPSSRGYPQTVNGAKRAAAVHLITEHWPKAVVCERATGRELVSLRRTALGITVTDKSR